MLVRLSIGCFVLVAIVVQAAVSNNSSKGQAADAFTLPKQASLYDDYDLNDHKALGNSVEGSGGAASLDEYADDDEEEQLSKVTSTSSSSTTTAKTTTTTQRTSSSTTWPNRWMKTTINYEQKKKNESSTPLSDLDTNEFKEDHEDYADDLEDDAYYNEPTLATKIAIASPPPTRLPVAPTRQPPAVQHRKPIWAFFSFLTRPPIAAGILTGLAIGILTSIILLICIVRRFHKREKSHSSYTTGLLYPNQYGYSKSPQEFYA
jgi:hypothetical protein